jgi:hypothetical protein
MAYDAFGVFGTILRELEWKAPIFFQRALPRTPNASSESLRTICPPRSVAGDVFGRPLARRQGGSTRSGRPRAGGSTRTAPTPPTSTSPPRWERPQAGPEVGPPPAFFSCIPTGMHGGQPASCGPAQRLARPRSATTSRASRTSCGRRRPAWATSSSPVRRARPGAAKRPERASGIGFSWGFCVRARADASPPKTAVSGPGR